MQTKTPPNELPPDVQTLDEAYPAMALADQVRAYAAEQVAAERERWLSACSGVCVIHAETGREMLRAAHFSEAISLVQMKAMAPV